MKRVAAVAAIAVLVAVAGIAGRRLMHRAPRPSYGENVRAPEGTRVRVEVLNATKVRGLARRATMQLRDHGFDVVAMGTTPTQQDSTVVLDRSNHPEWARLVARAIGATRVESRPDTSRYLDVTVLLGGAWRPPAEPFYP